MTSADYRNVVALWHDAAGVEVTEADTQDGVDAFLSRNPGLSLVAVQGRLAVGAILCSHDGRRGYLSHLAVAESHRRMGLGSRLVDRCVDMLDREGIRKCHVMVFSDNRPALSFWGRHSWTPRTNVSLFSMFTSSDRGQG